MSTERLHPYYLQLVSTDRDFEAEHILRLCSQVDFLLRSSNADIWQKIMPIRVENNQTFTFRNESCRLHLDKFYNINSYNNIGYNVVPLYEWLDKLGTTIINDYGGPFPCLKIIRELPVQYSTIQCDEDMAIQLAPALGISGKWDEPALRSGNLTWKYSAIEYLHGAMKDAIFIKDSSNKIRHIVKIEQSGNKAIISPLTFAHNPKTSIPINCYFTFNPDWYFYNSEQLAKFPQAEVLITNDIGIVQNNESSEKVVILAYFFGKEMIKTLHIEALKYRKIKLLYIESSDRKTRCRNLQEIIALYERLQQENLPFDICGLERSHNGLWYPSDISKFKILREAASININIPSNISTERYGMQFLKNTQDSLLDGLINKGDLTTVRFHIGVDPMIFLQLLIRGTHNTGVFPNKWQINQTVPFAFFSDFPLPKLRNDFLHLSEQKGAMFDFPQGNNRDIENRLHVIIHEFSYKLMIFYSRNLFEEHRALIQLLPRWANLHNIGVLLLTSEHTDSADSFIQDCCLHDFHIYRFKNRENTYGIEEYDPRTTDSEKFKVTLNETWEASELKPDELQQLEGRAYSEAAPIIHDQDNTSDQPSNMENLIKRITERN